MRLVALFLLASTLTLLPTAGEPQPGPNPQEQILLDAGLSTDGDALVEFFRLRMQPKADLDEMLTLARQLGDADAAKRAEATAKLVGYGSWAVPALRQVASDLNNPLATQHARYCLEWVEGKRSAELPIAAAKLLVERKLEAAAATLLAYLPLADDDAVIAGVKAALDSIAARPGKVDGALLAALRDPLPLRRAIAVEILAGCGHPEVLPEIRELLADPKLQVRLRAALVLVQHSDEPAVETLIDLLAEASPEECRQAEQALQHLAGELAPSPPLVGDDELSRKVRREAWAGWWRTIDGPALLAAFRQRTLNPEELAAARLLIDKLGDKSAAARQQATVELIALGSKAAVLLREAAKSPDAERARRAEICLTEIAHNEGRNKLPPSAPRLLAVRKPAGAAAALLGYVPFADDLSMKEEIVKSLKSLVLTADQEAAVVAALRDSWPVRRIVAAEVLAAASSQHWPTLRKLFADTDPEVRLRVALTLIYAHDRQAVAALIDLAAELPRDQCREAQELLQRLAGATAPVLAPGDDLGARKKFREAWQAWWKEHGPAVDLAQLDHLVSSSGLTVVAELGPNGSSPAGGKFGAPGGFGGPGGGPGGVPGGPGGPGGGLLQQPKGAKGKKGAGQLMPVNPNAGTDRLVALDRNLQPQWQIENLEYPIDFQMLPGDRVLIAEYYGSRVTERDLKGNILWQVNNLPGSPVNVQRLANGNTLIAAYNSGGAAGCFIVELDKAGKTLVSWNVTGGPAAAAAKRPGFLRAAYKTADGQTVCSLSTATCIWLDANGKETKSCPLPPVLAGVGYMGNIDVTPKGNVLMVQNNSTVAEFDPKGTIVWQANVIANRVVRLTNGNTLVASEMAGVVELDMQGKTLWQYSPPPGYRAVRARQVGDANRAGQPLATLPASLPPKLKGKVQ
jgi:HEAT repeat protein